jgi:LysM repeat protein
VAFECAPAYTKKLRENAEKASERTGFRSALARKSRKWQIHRAMKLLGLSLVALFLGSNLFAQTFGTTPAMSSPDSAQLQTLIKKLDEQNVKIDMLSQQILKLEQQIANTRPGVMVGESTPSPMTTAPAASSAAVTASVQPTNGGSTHSVARGETLTSIAKMHGVTVSDLQKYNHIENPLKLQAGQTIMIPASPAPSASPSASPSN